jgi:hypothetical protein
VSRWFQAGGEAIMPTVDVLYALVPDDELDGLRRLLRRRLPEEDLTVRPAQTGVYTRCDERLRQDLSAARHGGAIGALVGIVIGLATAWAVGGDTLSLFLLLAGGGAALGALIGGVVTMQLHEVLDDDPVGTVTLGPQDRHLLLEVHSERHAIWAHRVLARHPEVCLLESTELITVTEAGERQATDTRT